MSEPTLLDIYKHSYAPYLQKLQDGSPEDRENRKKQIAFFCNRPLAVVLATLAGEQPYHEDEVVKQAQAARDELRITLGTSRHQNGQIVHRETPAGAQFSALHAGPVSDIEALLDRHDLQLACNLRPSLRNLPLMRTV